MAKIELFTAGAQKFSKLTDFEKDYEKRINRFISFSINNIIVKKTADESAAMEMEGDRMLRRIKEKDKLILLHDKGRTMSSVQFADFISNLMGHVAGRIIFSIGGASGFSKAVSERADLKISFSKLTFPHDIFRVLFLEQLYRAFTIIKGQKYHR